MYLSSAGNLVIDAKGASVQGFSPDPDKVQELVAMPDGTTWHVTVEGWLAIMFSSTEVVQVYVNEINDATLTFPGDEQHCIIINSKMSQLTFVNNSGSVATVEVWGM